jgi:hypothetical protein
MDKNNKEQKQEQNGLKKPDPETLHTTDPQEHMEGPVSSLMQNVKRSGENESVLPDEQDEDKDEDENHYNDRVEKE